MSFIYCGLLLPSTPFPTKHCTCCPLVHVQATPQESWVLWVSVDWLHKAIYNSLRPLHDGFHKRTVYLRGNRSEQRCEEEKANKQMQEKTVDLVVLNCPAVDLSYLEQRSVSLQPLLQTALWKTSGYLQLLIPIWDLHVNHTQTQLHT